MNELENGELSQILTTDYFAAMYAILEPVKEFIKEPSCSPPADHEPLDDPIHENEEMYKTEYNLSKIPCLIVRGGENAGKSNLLQRLTMAPIFPHDEDVCTTLPIIYQYRRGPQSIPQIRIISAGKVETKYTALRRAKHDISEDMKTRTGGEVIENNSIAMVVQFIYPTAPILDIIDLPGLMRSSDSATTLSNAYINERTLCLDVIPAWFVDDSTRTTNLEQMRNLFESNEELKNRSIGVITQFDRAQDAANLRRLRTQAGAAEAMNYPPYPSGYVFTIANQDGHKSREFVEPFAALEGAALSEINKLAATDGCNVLIKKIFAKSLELLSPDLDATIGRLGNHIAKLKESDKNLGFPEAHEYWNEADREAVKTKFISTAATLIGNKLPAIALAYESEYLDPLSQELAAAMKDQTLTSRLESPERITTCRAAIWKILHDKFKVEKEFWKSHLQAALNEPDSNFNIQRFPETKVVMDYSDSLIQNSHQEIAKSIEALLALHFDQPLGSIKTVQVPIPPGTAPSSRSFTLTFSPDLVLLIVDKASLTLSSFIPSNFASESMARLFDHSPFIENKREERYEIKQKLCLLDIALTDLTELRDEAENYSV